MNIALRQLIAVMDALYPDIAIVEFYKILAEDGSVLARNGYSDPKRGYSCIKAAMLPEIMASNHKRAFDRFAPEIRGKFGRDPEPGEIRLAFRPMNGMFQSIFVDDVPQQTRAHILIETSPDNWQGHFLLDQEVTVDVAAEIQKYMIGTCTGSARLTADPGAASPRQARRFPEGRFIRDIVLSPLDVSGLLEKIEAARPAKVSATPISVVSDSADREAHWDDIALDSLWRRHLGKIFEDKKQRDKSASAVDMAFCLYLLGHCRLSAEFVSGALERVSPNIDERHPKLDYYLDKTINNALDFINKK